MSDQQQEGREAGTFFQKPKFDAFERLICSHLIEASKNEPLLTVIHICRASLALTDDARKTLGIDKDKMHSLYTVAQRLAAVSIQKDSGAQDTYSVNLNKSDFDTSLTPWIDSENGYEVHAWTGSPFWNERQKLKSAGNGERLFYLTCHHLTPASYQKLVSDFLEYSIPQIEDATRRLTTLVSPETYTELIKLYHGEKVES